MPKVTMASQDCGPEVVVWELTLACNFRCLHCGSACREAGSGELDPAEAQRVCEELVALGTRHVTLSGGEPLLRTDWLAICAHLTGSSIDVSLMTNGWMVDAPLVERARGAGLSRMGVSLDGLEATHDAIRRPGAFERVVAALATMRDAGLQSGVITTLLRRNVSELPAIEALLGTLGVGLWQIQIGCPMGNLAGRHDEVIIPTDVPEVLRFAEGVRRRGNTKIYIGDCLGYFTRTSQALRSTFAPGAQWGGCPAGRSGLGIRHNGDVCGCSTLRGADHIEGNLRETPLAEIWRRPGAFAWNRQRDRASLTGFCRRCQFADVCLAGCTNVRETLSPSLGENPYCAHRVAIEPLLHRIRGVSDRGDLLASARRAAELGLHEVADSCLTRLFALHSFCVDSLLLAALVAYRVGDFERCRIHNERVLRMEPINSTGMKGLGLALAELDRTDEALTWLYRSLDHAAPGFTDPFHDLATLLRSLGREAEAEGVLARIPRPSDPDGQVHRRGAESCVLDSRPSGEEPT